MLNAFKGKRKFSAYGIMSSTGKTGLNFTENMSYGIMNDREGEVMGGLPAFGDAGNEGSSSSNHWGSGFPKRLDGRAALFK